MEWGDERTLRAIIRLFYQWCFHTNSNHFYINFNGRWVIQVESLFSVRISKAGRHLTRTFSHFSVFSFLHWLHRTASSLNYKWTFFWSRPNPYIYRATRRTHTYTTTHPLCEAWHVGWQAVDNDRNTRRKIINFIRFIKHHRRPSHRQ